MASPLGPGPFYVLLCPYPGCGAPFEIPDRNGARWDGTSHRGPITARARGRACVQGHYRTKHPEIGARARSKAADDAWGKRQRTERV